MPTEKNKKKTLEEQIGESIVQAKEASLNAPMSEECLKDNEELSEYGKLVKKYNGNHKKAIFEYCFLNNIFYHEKVLTELLEEEQTRTRLIDQGVIYGSSDKREFCEKYVNKLEKEKDCEGLTFFSQLKQTNFEIIYSEEIDLLGFSEDTKKNRMQCIDILSYDPFATEDMADRPQLYRDLASMLTESMRKDVAKAKAALSIVRGYNTLEKYQNRISEIMKSESIDEDTQRQIDQLVKLQKTLQDSINATAIANSFTVKGIGTNGKGMLSDVMNQIDEKGIDEGVVNFYDIETSRAIEEIANISFRAQLNQVNLSKTDYADILSSQRVIVKEAQAKAKAAVEMARLAREKLVKQDLLKELERDYRKKGIDEKEIQDFIKREFKMYEG